MAATVLASRVVAIFRCINLLRKYAGAEAPLTQIDYFEPFNLSPDPLYRPLKGVPHAPTATPRAARGLFLSPANRPPMACFSLRKNSAEPKRKSAVRCGLIPDQRSAGRVPQFVFEKLPTSRPPYRPPSPSHPYRSRCRAAVAPIVPDPQGRVRAPSSIRVSHMPLRYLF